MTDYSRLSEHNEKSRLPESTLELKKSFRRRRLQKLFQPCQAAVRLRSGWNQVASRSRASGCDEMQPGDGEPVRKSPAGLEPNPRDQEHEAAETHRGLCSVASQAHVQVDQVVVLQPLGSSFLPALYLTYFCAIAQCVSVKNILQKN